MTHLAVTDGGPAHAQAPRRSPQEELAAEHPCYTESAARVMGRLHVAVAPRCNLGCNYCERSLGELAVVSQGPGAAERILTPSEASARVREVRQMGRLRVVGVAGPGEPLANPETFAALDRIHSENPDLLLCMSTNGLLLEESLLRLLRCGVRALTVTISAVSEEVAGALYSWAQPDSRRIPRDEAAAEILSRQWRGLRAAVRAGLLVKVNSVFVPEVNDRELPDVARLAAEAGAHKHNIMPLIPRHLLRCLRAPDRAEVEQMRRTCERWLPQFRACMQCRADACVIPRQRSGGADGAS